MPRNPDSPVTGTSNDAEFRRRRAQHARAAQDSIDSHIKRLVERSPELTSEQRNRLALLLRGES
jgi:hypothetical protein